MDLENLDCCIVIGDLGEDDKNRVGGVLYMSELGIEVCFWIIGVECLRNSFCLGWFDLNELT